MMSMCCLCIKVGGGEEKKEGKGKKKKTCGDGGGTRFCISQADMRDTATRRKATLLTKLEGGSVPAEGSPDLQRALTAVTPGKGAVLLATRRRRGPATPTTPPTYGASPTEAP